MTKASDNDFPSLLLTEQGSAPTTPAASHQRLYIRTSDHTLVTVNSSGTVTAVSSGGSTAAVGAKATKNATQSLTNNTETAVTFPGTDLFDSDSIHDPASNSSRMTIPAAKGGQYLVAATIQFVANGTGFRYIFFKVNGTTSGDYSSQAANASVQYLQASTVLSLAAGDYVETWAYQNSTAGLNVDTLSTFSISRLGT